ncbi:hypothetical protein BDA96_03G396800 [Sorghum bicolor]|uniref:Uncharacterized protein n=2 Tax=Sorghum bicolor TaxID=4558 RepID=A0A921RHA8_SORBI|nr:hypothetical protein BDA96_03G396800 [Sorghum bicolor]OQU87921.1 hypothetical protein SORBI_3003G368150 [Sorghum bicolor]
MPYHHSTKQIEELARVPNQASSQGGRGPVHFPFPFFNFLCYLEPKRHLIEFIFQLPLPILSPVNFQPITPWFLCCCCTRRQ